MRTSDLAAHYLRVASFLTQFGDFIDSVGYDTARNSSPDGEYDYEKLTYVSHYVDSFAVRFTVTGPDSKELMTNVRREIGGKWDKRPYSDTFRILGDWNGLNIEIQSNRDAVCTPRIVGTEDKVIPAVEAVEAQPERTEKVDIIEWDCGTLLEDAPIEVDPDYPDGKFDQEGYFGE